MPSSNLGLRLLAVLTLGVLGTVFDAHACDPCALYNTSKLNGPSEQSFTLAVSEQFSSYDRTDAGSGNVRDGEFTREFSTTQLTGGYDVTEQFGVQVSVPLIIRRFTERRRFQDSSDSETGIGDIAIFGSFTPIARRSVAQSLFVTLTTGIKLPTGDTGSLSDSIQADDTADSSEPDEDPAARNILQLAHHTVSTSGAGGGRILSIGSGSFDYIFGASVSGRRDRLFYLAAIQYTIRTEGDFNYRFDNDLVWSSGPGVYALLDDDYSLAVRAGLSGEHKDKDTLNGVEVAGSQLSNIFAGPELLATFGSHWTGELALDLPISTDTTDATLETDWRVRAGLGYRF